MGQQTEENRIRLVLLLDDHGLFRGSLRHFLASERGFEIVVECSTPAEALKVVSSSTVDIVLLDFDLGSERGYEFITTARQAGYRGQFLLVTGAADARSAAIALRLGASDIFLKSDAPERIAYAIRLVANGEGLVDSRVIQMLAEQLIDCCPQFDDQGSADVLEERERNVLLGILSGLTNKKIGVDMGLAESPVKNIVQRLFVRVGVNKRGQLLRVALEGSWRLNQRLISRQLEKTQLTDQPNSNHTLQPLATDPSLTRQAHG